MGSTNISMLTRSHRAIASKRRARREQPKEILFDETARFEFLTGFHKRKLAKQEAGKKRAQEREHAERLEMRREVRGSRLYLTKKGTLKKGGAFLIAKTGAREACGRERGDGGERV
jgi:hypothetical protein